MPVVRIHGTPADAGADVLNFLVQDIKDAVPKIEELEIDSSKVTVILPADRITEGLGEEVIVYIDLFDSDKRTSEVKKKLATVVGNIVARAFPKASFVEVLPLGYNSKEEGYWNIRR